MRFLDENSSRPNWVEFCLPAVFARYRPEKEKLCVVSLVSRGLAVPRQAMRVALVYPPTCDPTAPYLSLPTLTAYLRRAGVEVLQVDANAEAYDFLLREERLQPLAESVRRQHAVLEQRRRRSHTEDLRYVALGRALADAESVPRQIATAVATLRDRTGTQFFDVRRYDQAVATVERALALVGAAYAPLNLDFVSYRTPFSMLTMREVERDAAPVRNPFHEYFATALVPRLKAFGAKLVGISVSFPGQLQLAYTLGYLLRHELPDVQLVAGGPALSQALTGLPEGERPQALGPFHAAVLYEGEAALLELVRAQEAGQPRLGIIQGGGACELSSLPAPDFDGLLLDKYLSPALLLPYDLARGCYFGRCAFCHYGLAESGTARYRERDVETAFGHLRELAARYGCGVFYFSHDCVAPKTLAALAERNLEAGLPFRFATDLRPERTLTKARALTLAAGGALSVALGVESGSPRVLELIDKGVTVAEIRAVIGNLATAGIAVELMAFTGFPTETKAEAQATLRLLDEVRAEMSLFICGEFALVRGSKVAMEPARFGLAELWRVRGDELGLGLFYTLEPRFERDDEAAAQADQALDRLSQRFVLRRYPWAGALSTAHTLLWYAHFGPRAFAAGPGLRFTRAPATNPQAERLAAKVEGREAAAWGEMIYERREVSRQLYRQLTNEPRPRRRRRS